MDRECHVLQEHLQILQIEILQGKVTLATKDQKITVNEMKTYVEERVPELSEQYHGSAQYPTSFSFGQDFPIVLVKP